MRGGPRKPEWSKKRIPFSMRTTPEIRARLVAAAEASGRSMAGEIEYRLDRSFAGDDIASIVRAAVREAMQPTERAAVPPVNFNLSIPDTHDCSFN